MTPAELSSSRMIESRHGHQGQLTRIGHTVVFATGRTRLVDWRTGGYTQTPSTVSA